jgi:hypothetical protein
VGGGAGRGGRSGGGRNRDDRPANGSRLNHPHSTWTGSQGSLLRLVRVLSLEFGRAGWRERPPGTSAQPASYIRNARHREAAWVPAEPARDPTGPRSQRKSIRGPLMSLPELGRTTTKRQRCCLRSIDGSSLLLAAPSEQQQWPVHAKGNRGRGRRGGGREGGREGRRQDPRLPC